MIVSGATEGFLLLAKSLSSKFHSIYIEDPTIDITRDIFQTMNYNLVPVEVDHSGMRVDALSSIAPGHLVLLTPSHQFPTGVLSIQRRHQIIGMLEEADSFAIEDDYDSEFRLRGIPVPPLQNAVAFKGYLCRNIQQNAVAQPSDRIYDCTIESNRCHCRNER